MRQNLITEAAAKKLLDGSLTRFTSYGSCNLLAPLAASGLLSPSYSSAGGDSNGNGGAAGMEALRLRASGDGSGGGGGGGGLGKRMSEGSGSTRLGVFPSPKIDIACTSGSHPPARSAPVSPAASPRAPPPSMHAVLVGSLSEKSAHEYFDNW